ncbi:HIT family protein [Candidatus Marinarcus aquaticus]|uniref:HIT family protein n=1 Tax=Candidatus Marinarcus aquaticus TaxID=2044504 RepID=A0A4Q0XTV5_9BACT|nr:HIT family protein [Candidatus Marinarcus aquaticus]RXJ60876.1 HIT family protein [Candidatus Marinarcus aquaticus]
MKEQLLYENEFIKIKIENNELPWLKIFTQEPYKEFSQCDMRTRLEIFQTLDIIEKEMLEYFEPEKINIASFGNYVPHVHFHIMARFKEDAYFPESVWGEKQRESKLKLKAFKPFFEQLLTKLEAPTS